MDLLLAHPPAFFDFRNRSDIYWPFFGTSSGTPITPLYEMFPVGFKSLKKYLSNYGHPTEIVNFSTVLLKYPDIDLEKLFKELDVKFIGIDLHWMVHVQGSLGLAEFIKKVRPDVPIIFGGISSTYFCEELINYPFIDMIMRGYDTHVPMNMLLKALKEKKDLNTIPNLVWKEANTVKFNDFSYTPKKLNNGINFSDVPLDNNSLIPIRDVLTTENAGCAHNCGWCAGSRDSFKRINKVKYAVVQKDLEAIEYEMKSIAEIPGNNKKYNLYSLGTYSESPSRLGSILGYVSESNLNSVMYDQFSIPTEEITKKMASTSPKVIVNMSPMSHDVRISKISGRGTYTMDEMEDWIEVALNMGIYEVDVWFLIGLEEQDKNSLFETLAYCRHLLEKFKGKRVIPYICPMTPFLDPASNYFEEPEKYGYKLFYKTVEEHRRGMEKKSLVNRLNYETKWLSREELVYVSYEVIKQLFLLKGEYGIFPKKIVSEVVAKIDEAVYYIKKVYDIENIQDKELQEREYSKIADKILELNNETLKSGVRNPAVPIVRKIGGRWYDEIPKSWTEEFLHTLTK
jgi:clorobiocin/coumermycin A biosynthesis protein CloN6/CouN6